MTVMVRLEHLHSVPGFKRGPGFCHPQSRAWCRAHGVDWNEFRHHGIASDVLVASGDPMAIALARHAESVEAKRGR